MGDAIVGPYCEATLWVTPIEAESNIDGWGPELLLDVNANDRTIADGEIILDYAGVEELANQLTAWLLEHEESIKEKEKHG